MYRFFLINLVLFLPLLTQAARYEVGVWVPWFADEAGAESALEQIDEIDILYPFVYEVESDGTIVNRVDFTDDHWEDLLAEAEDERVDVIPTIAWFDGQAIHEVLSNRRSRRNHIRDIVRLVERNDFAGVNIDYESKLAATIDYYSDFLEELKDELGRRTELTCTVEARTPPESRWREVPSRIEYANDYRAMSRHCDWVEIMAYDQQRADWRMNEKRRGVPYNPVADTEWVEKVLDLALEDFDEDEVFLGVPTYGRAWDVTVAADWYKDYDLVATLNQPRILELADKYEVRPGRTAGDEAVITYFPEDSVWRILDALPTPAGTPRGYEAAAKALLVATYADIEIPVRMITWSDAEAIAAKLELVEDYDLQGVAIFKVDGEEDPKLWRRF
jgi:spore germination protein YaaH